LIQELLVFITRLSPYYFLVHGMDDTFTKTRVRIIRLRFPEWRIWDLPLAAHELGHVVIGENLESEEKPENADQRILTPFIQRQRASLVRQDPGFKQMSMKRRSGVQQAAQWAESRIHEFLADAFATYTMGPAYACSAILLRLHPLIDAKDGRPSDAQRAHVILSMLKWMNDKAPITDPPYISIISRLH